MYVPASRPPQRLLQTHGRRRNRNRRRAARHLPLRGRQQCPTRRLRLRRSRWFSVLAVRENRTEGTAELTTASAFFIRGTPIDDLGDHRPATAHGKYGLQRPTILLRHQQHAADIVAEHFPICRSKQSTGGLTPSATTGRRHEVRPYNGGDHDCAHMGGLRTTRVGAIQCDRAPRTHSRLAVSRVRRS